MSSPDPLYAVLSFGPTEPKKFLDFWDALYTGYDEDFYQQNIGQSLTPERIAAWFKWKNDGKLSEKKANSSLRYSLPEEQLPSAADADKLRFFLNRQGGAIWHIFWLHLQHPDIYPIYDQHVHRAMAFMLGWKKLEIPVHNPTKVRSYLDSYVPFFNRFADFPR